MLVHRSVSLWIVFGLDTKFERAKYEKESLEGFLCQ